MHLRIRSGMLAAAGSTVAAAVVFLAAPQPAHAVPSFARQTGLACEACHTVYPELTPFGRRFKLNGYTLTTKQQVADIDQRKDTRLSLSEMPPLSVMVQAESTWWNKPPADSGGNGKAQGNDTLFPQQLSLFYAGKISDHVGAQFQLTYEQATNSFGIDNSEIRFADQAFNNNLVYGVTLNNAATMSDLWNTTPVWQAGAAGWANPEMDPNLQGTFIEGLGAGTTVGLGAFADWKNSYYFEVDAYRTMDGYSNGNFDGMVDSNTLANQAVIQGFAPYWRAAYERDWGHNSLEVGTFGLYARAIPNANVSASVSPGNPNEFLDTAIDTQYQYIGDNNIFTVAGTLIHESQKINDNGVGAGLYADQSNIDINHLILTGSYFYDRKYGGSISFNRLSGSNDATEFNGNPGSQYEVFEADYLPWLNTKLVAQYTAYNYVNNGPNNLMSTNPMRASDWNTFMLGLWTAF